MIFNKRPRRSLPRVSIVTIHLLLLGFRSQLCSSFCSSSGGGACTTGHSLQQRVVSIPPPNFPSKERCQTTLRMVETAQQVATTSSDTTTTTNQNNNNNNSNNYGNDNEASTSSSSSTFTMTTPGTIGDWEDIEGNWVLRPPIEEPPRALLHFLGGALVGSSPHVTYRYILEKLAEKGYLIVATPFQLSFDHLETCDDVISRFELMAPNIARQYGALPVVGIGHSCGALLQLLITSLFPDTPRAANALLSFNNKPVNEAVPFFEEIFTPLFIAIAARDGTIDSNDGDNNSNEASGTKAISLSLQMAKAATEGKLPSDKLLNELIQLLSSPLGGGGSSSSSSTNDQIQIPQQIRDMASQIMSPTTTALSDAGILPVLNQAVLGLEQIPQLINEVADGARDFTPTPSAVRAAARKAYRARRTLILEYSEDPLDESEQIEQLLDEARSVTRMRRPMVEIDVQRRVLEGGHASPLLAPPLDMAQRAEDILGSDAAKEGLFYKDADSTVEELARWLEEGGL